MNKIIFVLLISIGCCTYVSAQEDDKIKGNRNVTIKQTYVNSFNSIVVGENFSVEIIYNQKASVEIETDDNLHDIISFEVIDSALIFKTTKKITSRKKMKITVNYTDILQNIETKDDGEIVSLTSLELKNTTLKTSGNSKAYLNVKATNFSYVSLDKAKVKLNLTADSTRIELGDNSKLDALITTKSFNMVLYQRANARIEGSATHTSINTDNSSSFNGNNFTTNTCNLVCDINSEIYISVLEHLSIDAAGSSEIYLFNDPKIIINKFTGSAKLQKKTK
ncbi:DUF2807 domain-containing protein [Flavobacteriales bacterium 34_180_T64]|nr:DUF2807 domain-containing protein [Flavobacteriales bacterium 34_180_T64]